MVKVENRKKVINEGLKIYYTNGKNKNVEYRNKRRYFSKTKVVEVVSCVCIGGKEVRGSYRRYIRNNVVKRHKIIILVFFVERPQRQLSKTIN